MRLGKDCERLQTDPACGDDPYFSYQGQKIEIICAGGHTGVIVDPTYRYGA